jgi:hypothetical protein
MYCSENCLNSDWTSAHKGDCNKNCHVKNLVPFKLDEFNLPGQESELFCHRSVLLHLITYIGLDYIKKTVQENKPMPSLLGDPRTKGFQDGKFGTATLEALLSLEDNFGKLTSEEVNEACIVRTS